MRTVTSSDDVTLALHDVGGDGPVLLLSHATGFHARVYQEFAHHLKARFHVWALDHRGHGDSTEPLDGNASWYGTGRDVAAVVAAIGERPLVGFGHSMGATSLLMAEHAQPGLFSAIVAFEPIIFPADPPQGAVTFETRLVAATHRRRYEFPSVADAIANFSAKPPLNGVTPAALADYVTFGTRTTSDGTVVLKCRPAYEALTYVEGSKHTVWATLPEITCPVLIMSGNVSNPGPGALAAGHADRLPHGSFREYPNLSHFGPIEDPATIAAATAAFLTEHGPTSRLWR